MRTYEDLLRVGESETAKGEFARLAVMEFNSSTEAKEAAEAERYYNKHNTTIETFQKWLYTVSGRKIEDVYSANYKLKTLFFRRMVLQQVQYILGNGVKLQNENNKDRLGKDFDFQLQRAAKLAMIGGRSFGYWNADHLEIFGYACTDKHAGFCPLYSDETAELMAGIRFRFKKVGNKTITRMTLFEPEGITEYKQTGSDPVQVMKSRSAYKTVTKYTIAEGIVDVMEEGYNGRLPIVPMYANDCYESEFVGLQENIDCYDLIKSGLANNIDDASEIFWLVKNAGGMDDTDLAQFIQRIKTTHAAGVDSQDGGSAEPHSVDVPTDARAKMLEILRTDIYDDMMLLDRRSMSAAQKTNQELQMAYQPQDNKCDDFEFFLLDFLDGIFELAGMPDEEASFSRSKAVNELEYTNMVLAAANYVSPECIIMHLPWLTSDEQIEEVQKFESEQINRFNNMQGRQTGAAETGEEDLEDEFGEE